jgi:hypothetical protein
LTALAFVANIRTTMSAIIPGPPKTEPPPAAPSTPPVPKRITNAQTVCNERNEKKKLCNGHLKQLKTGGEPAEVHLRGDDVLYKCQLCGTLYMGPPLGHVRDPGKQHRFVEAELSAVLQAAGGTLPVIKKNDKGVFVLVEPEGAQAHAAPAAKPAAPAAAVPAEPAKPATSSASTPVAAEKSTTAPAGPKPAAQPNRELNRRTSYAGVVDTGPVAGETREQKIERLQKVVAGAKQRAEEGGAEPAAVTTAEPSPADAAAAEAPAVAAVPEQAKAAPAAPATSPATGGQPDRTLMKRSTYAGVVDTGPIPGETPAQKIERLTKLAAAAKQKAEEGG